MTDLVQDSPAIETPSAGRGETTRQRILDLTSELVAAKGFSATSIEELMVGVGLTKSGFFYHFPSKLRLALRLLERLMGADAVLFQDLERKARRAHGDPLWSFLDFLGALAARAAEPDGWRPGAKIAAAVYQETSYDRQIRQLVVTDAERRRAWLRGWLGEIAERWPARRPVDLDALTEALTAVLYGNPLLAGAAQGSQVLAGQLRLYREWVRTLFAPRSEALDAPMRSAA